MSVMCRIRACGPRDGTGLLTTVMRLDIINVNNVKTVNGRSDPWARVSYTLRINHNGTGKTPRLTLNTATRSGAY